MSKLSKYKSCGFIKAPISGKLLYLVLDNVAGKNGSVIIPQRKISKTLGISRSTVRRNLRRLERIGAIRIIPTFHCDGSRAANKYIIK